MLLLDHLRGGLLLAVVGSRRVEVEVGRVLVDGLVGEVDVVGDWDRLESYDEERSLFVGEDGIPRLSSLGGGHRRFHSGDIVRDDGDDIFINDKARCLVAFEGDVVVLEAVGSANWITIGWAHVAVQFFVVALLGAHEAIKDLEDVHDHSPSVDELNHKRLVD